MSNIVAIVQARMGSSRLPGKALMDLNGAPVLAHVIARTQAIPGVDQVVVATTTESRDRPLLALAEAAGAGTFAGSEADVLDRYYHAARAHSAETIVRVTADCPLLDPAVSGAVLARFAGGDADYASNIDPPRFPDGLDTEVFSAAALADAWEHAQLPGDREHVTPFIRGHPERFRKVNVTAPEDLSHLRWTLDQPLDLDLIRAIYARLPHGSFAYQAVLAILAADPTLCHINQALARAADHRRATSAQEMR
jgi:spore coat polysaccharide biosynthesis protein SpsF (cytidylyltransferase family)